MVFLLNFLPRVIALGTGMADPSRLSEAEVVAQSPVMIAATMLLLGAGLACDVYLLLRLRGRLPSAPDAAPLLQIGPKPWSTHDLLCATGALIVVFVTGNGLLTLGLTRAHVDEASAVPWLLALNMGLYLASLLGFGAFFRQRRIDWPQALGVRRASPLPAVAFGAICFFAVLPPLVVVFVISAKLCRLVGIDYTPQPVAEMLATSDSAVVVGLISVFAIAVAPVFEEFFFRGFAYPALKHRWGAGKALVAVSATFAVIHLHAPSVGPLFALAAGLALAYELTGSLLAPITMHALFNATNVALLLYLRAHA